jgi:alkylhydroperoxidase family enzyme
MLGRSVGITDEQLGHLGDEVPPPGLFSPAEAVLVRYARQSTLRIVIDDALYGDYTQEQIMDICLIVGLSNVVNRFHATFKTDVDPSTLATILEPGASPVPLPTY